MESIVTNEDCMALMSRYPDKYFDLAVVDPPYGINYSEIAAKKSGEFYGNAKAPKKHYKIKDWDKEPPSPQYFDMLKRKSKNQIIFGANHFIDNMPFNVSSSCWIVWDKINGENNFADCELAWTSFNTAVRKFTFRWNGMLQGNMSNKEKRIHPTQKPVALYDWIFKNYAKDGDKILDTHLGSGSSRISAHKAGLYFVGCELDKDYFDASVKRYEDYIKQQTLFNPKELNKLAL